MASTIPRPHEDDFLASMGDGGLAWGQVVVSPVAGGGYEIRHVADRGVDAAGLRLVGVEGLRDVAMSTADGRYRPLRGAPNLPGGWRCRVRDGRELVEGLERIYPGAIADRWVLSRTGGWALDFAEVASRQVGRSKVLMGLQGPALAAVVEAGCGVGSCVRRRHWVAAGAGVGPDCEEGKSAVPCLEPCPFFLGFARACADIELKATVTVELAPDDLATVAAALRHALEHPPRGLREGEIAEPLHPWRVARMLARHAMLREASMRSTESSDE